jgi:hypothetical protein
MAIIHTIIFISFVEWGFRIDPFSLSQKVIVVITGVLEYATQFAVQHDI